MDGYSEMKGEPNIKMVTFDLWETLVLERNGADSQRTLIRCRKLAKVLNEFGINTSVEQLFLVIKAMAPWLGEIWETDRDVSHLEQIQFLVNAASKGSVILKDDWIGELSSAYVSPLFEVPPYLNPDARRVLQRLRERNKRIGLICNTGHTPGFVLRQFLRKEGVAKYFDLMLFSDEVGIRKPNSEIFQIAAKKMDAEPCEAIHVGDNLRSDVWGAKNAGFKAIYLSTETGRDKIAESDPGSLASLSRKFGSLNEKEIIPDRTIVSLGGVVEAIESLENNWKRNRA
jgi:putative hydrolase of the HAD superfamily